MSKAQGWQPKPGCCPPAFSHRFLRARGVKMSRQGRNKWLCHGLAWTAIISAAVCDAGGSGWRWVHGAVQQQGQNPGAHCLTQQVLTSEAALTYGYRNLKEEERIFFSTGAPISPLCIVDFSTFWNMCITYQARCAAPEALSVPKVCTYHSPNFKSWQHLQTGLREHFMTERVIKEKWGKNSLVASNLIFSCQILQVRWQK